MYSGFSMSTRPSLSKYMPLSASNSLVYSSSSCFDSLTFVSQVDFSSSFLCLYSESVSPFFLLKSSAGTGAKLANSVSTIKSFKLLSTIRLLPPCPSSPAISNPDLSIDQDRTSFNSWLCPDKVKADLSNSFFK